MKINVALETFLHNDCLYLQIFNVYKYLILIECE